MMLFRANTIYASVVVLIVIIIALVHYSPTTTFGVSSSPSYNIPTNIPSHLLKLRLPKEYSSLYPSLVLPPILLNHPLLYTRLHAFLSRPVRSHQSAVESNERNCPRELSDRLVNPDQLEGDGEFWRNDVQEVEIRKRRVEMVEYLVKIMEGGEKVVWEEEKSLSEESLEVQEQKEAERIEEEKEKLVEEANKELAEAMIETPEYAKHKRSPIPSSSSNPTNRGIVTTGGNSDTMTRLVTLMRILRKHQSVTLPCEIWAFPHELDINSWEYKELTTSLDCVVREAPGLEKDAGAWKNFQIKGLAIASSSFKEIVYLDSDNIPLRDPTYLFESEKYLREGSGKAVFWPDLSRDHVDNAIWRLMGVECDMDDFTLESGQIIIDKAGNDGLNLAALHLAAYMQSQHEFWFHMCGGDKDTFRWAFVALDIPFTRASRWATALGTTIAHQNNKFCGHTVLQYELDIPHGATRPRPLFVHSNLMKHISAVSPDNAFTHLKRMSLDEYSQPSLNQAHMWVYWSNGRGMCTDLELWDNGDKLTDFEKESQYVVFETLDQVEGKPFEGFKDMFLAEGGRVGGWRKRRRDKSRLDGPA